MTGSTNLKSPVISTTEATAVSGERVAAANTAAIPTAAYTAGSPTPGPKASTVTRP